MFNILEFENQRGSTWKGDRIHHQTPPSQTRFNTHHMIFHKFPNITIKGDLFHKTVSTGLILKVNIKNIEATATIVNVASLFLNVNWCLNKNEYSYYFYFIKNGKRFTVSHISQFKIEDLLLEIELAVQNISFLCSISWCTLQVWYLLIFRQIWYCFQK